jgi:hypothetical protein
VFRSRVIADMFTHSGSRASREVFNAPSLPSLNFVLIWKTFLVLCGAEKYESSFYAFLRPSLPPSIALKIIFSHFLAREKDFCLLKFFTTILMTVIVARNFYAFLLAPEIRNLLVGTFLDLILSPTFSRIRLKFFKVNNVF